jgi:hypothetical protein
MNSTTHDKTPHRRRALRWLPAGLVPIAVVVVAGCGGSSYSSSAPKAAPSQPTHTSAQAAQPKPTSTKAHRSRPKHKRAQATQSKPAAPSAPAAPPAAPSASGIPQNNGGDHDADNNGGPSDGDGNI